MLDSLTTMRTRRVRGFSFVLHNLSFNGGPFGLNTYLVAVNYKRHLVVAGFAAFMGAAFKTILLTSKFKWKESLVRVSHAS